MMTASTMICKPWEIAVVPFPFVDGPDSKSRPAFVISSKEFNKKNRHTMMGMITTAKKNKWPSDIIINDWEKAHLPAPSVARMKVFTIDNRLIRKVAGKLSEKDKKALQRGLKNISNL